MEENVTSLVRERPALAIGCAFGVGLAGYFALKNIPPPAKRNPGPVRASSPGILSTALTPALTQFQSEFDRIAIDGLGTVKDSIVARVSDDFAENPLKILGVALSVGFGLGSLESDDLKRGAIRIAKLLAVKSIDEVGPRAARSSLPKSLNPQGDHANEHRDEFENDESAEEDRENSASKTLL